MVEIKTYTIVIPARNEEKYISLCLNSIVNLNYPKEYIKVKVYDGKSDDKTQEIVEEYHAKHDFINLIINERQTAPYAFNHGIENSNSDVLIILGAHSEMDSEYLNECNAAFENDEKIGCVGGLLENVYEDPDSEAIGVAMSSSFGVGNVSFRTGDKEGFVDTVAFGAYKREVFSKVGLFDAELTRNQDDEFNFRLLKNGYKIWLSKSIKAKYYVRAGFSKLWRQYYQYGYWKVFVNKKHKTVTTVRQLVPAIFVFGVFGGLLLCIISPILFILYSAVLMSYLIGALLAAKRTKSKLLFKVVRSFLILHFSYGIGYLEGILQFVILNKSPSTVNQKLSR
jgi:glycosyltransferase involved in cell wall biosynthesis